MFFRQLENSTQGEYDGEDAEDTIQIAVNDFEEEEEDFTQKLERLVTLTGNVVSFHFSERFKRKNQLIFPNFPI